jgi:beta-N-acetylhexosaminidase
MKTKPRRTYPLWGLVWAGIEGVHLSEEEKKNIQELGISGLILFKRNIESLSQLFELCREIHNLNPSPLIMIDREGGAVDRLRHLVEFPSWPAPAKLAEVCTLEEIEKTAFYMAQEMKALGICMNFAPCVDVPSVYGSLFEGRLWGDTPEDVSEKSLAYFHGLEKVGLAACAKHFPGHGGVMEDSHLRLPVDQRDFKTLYTHDLIPFRKIIAAGVEAIMSAHVLYPKMDPIHPATLSSFFLAKTLREEMGFQGLIVSDDLDMKALYEKDISLSVVMVQALSAGVDILLKCEPCPDWKALVEEVECSLSQKKFDIGEWELKRARLERFKQKYASIKPVSSFEELKKGVMGSDAQKWCQKLNEKLPAFPDSDSRPE